MKKKKQKTAELPPTTSVAAITDLKSIIRDHSLFFDKLIELIPAKFYLPTDADTKPWFQGLNKAAKNAAKQKTKENIKKSRRDRHDPDKPQSSTLELLKQSIENEKHDEIKSVANLDGGGGGGGGGGGDDRSVTYEKLRQRLHRRIEELRGNRGSGDGLRSDRSERRENKRKRGNEVEENHGDSRISNISKTEGEIEKEATEATKGIEFGKMRIGGEEERGRKKKKLSKEKELEMAKKLEEAKKDPVAAKKHSWKAAVSRASGAKVHDDPKLLKQSVKKEKRRHEKNVEKWKDRVETREKVKGEKQQKRSDNIAERKNQKKMRKIAKREKKLMRPGFEGRKEGYINEA